VSICAYKT